MLVNVDARGLEVVCAAFLSQDKILMSELETGTDIHGENQKAFGLPTRLVAKILKFRILYGGSAYSFSLDPDFTSVSKSVKYWEEAIDNYYNKYKGIKEWHSKILRDVVTTGLYSGPLGRHYTYEPRDRRGELVWPDTDIKNWPVQGLGADVMVVARIAVRQRWKRAGLTGKLISTVHDSIVADVPDHEVSVAASLFDGVFRELPKLVSQTYGIDWNVPMVGEVSVGPNMLDLTEIKL